MQRCPTRYARNVYVQILGVRQKYVKLCVYIKIIYIEILMDVQFP